MRSTWPIWPNAPRRQGCIGVPGCCWPGCSSDSSGPLGSRAQGQVRNPKAVPRAVTPREALKPEERATIALFRQGLAFGGLHHHAGTAA